MEQRISDYIKQQIGEGGNLIAYNILINVAYKMLRNNSTEIAIRNEIDILLSNPTWRLNK
jgi:hypothetical protein